MVSFEKICERKWGLTELVRSLVDHAEQLVGVDQLDEGGDVHRGLGRDEQDTEGNCQLVEPVEFPVLSDRVFNSTFFEIPDTNLCPPCGPQQDCHEDHEEGGDDVGDGDASEEEVEDGVLGDCVVPAAGQQFLVWFDEASIGDSLSVPGS